MGASNAIWNSEGSAKREAVRDMFARIAPRYDFLNSLLSFRLHRRWRSYAVSMLRLKPGDKALDVCCGTGDFVQPLRRAVGEAGTVLGLDFCPPMLEIARGKSVPANALMLGDACRLPIADSVFNAVTVGWGIRNVPDIDGAHKEIARVLAPGGRFVSLDMATPKNPLVLAASNLFCQKLVPALGSLFGQREAYTYLPKSTERFWTREMLRESMEAAGFTNCGWKDVMFGNICIHWGTKA